MLRRDELAGHLDGVTPEEHAARLGGRLEESHPLPRDGFSMTPPARIMCGSWVRAATPAGRRPDAPLPPRGRRGVDPLPDTAFAPENVCDVQRHRAAGSCPARRRRAPLDRRGGSEVAADARGQVFIGHLGAALDKLGCRPVVARADGVPPRRGPERWRRRPRGVLRPERGIAVCRAADPLLLPGRKA